MKKKTTALLTALLLFVAVVSAGCAASYRKDAAAPSASSATAGMSVPPKMAAEGAVTDSGNIEEAVADVQGDVVSSENVRVQQQPVNTGARKIILSMDVQLQTTSFDEAVEQLSVLAEGVGGFVQDSYVEGKSLYEDRGSRHASFTVRVPVEKLEAFVEQLGDNFNITSKQQTGTDITDQYYDTQTRLDTLKLQEERLLSMLEQADELEYLLQVERELADVRYEIESLTGAMQRMESQIAMSTVTIGLQEVVEYEPVEGTPLTLGERVGRAFTNSWRSFADFCELLLLGIVSAVPFLLLLAVVVCAVVALVRRAAKRRAKSAAAAPVYSLHHNAPEQETEKPKEP